MTLEVESPMTACPEFAALERRAWSVDTRTHVAQCGSCRVVMELIDERSQAAASRDRRVECARFEALLAVRIGGKIGSTAAAMLDEHLHDCDDCRAIADTMGPATDAVSDHTSLPAIDPGAYSLGLEVARGGMGRIVSARDLRIGRPVAVKELLSKTASQAARFEREARVTARLQHPGIVPIYEIGRWDNGTPFYSMRMVKGRTLRAAIRDRSTLEARLALVPAVIAATEAVAFAHASSVIHRDLTPANIMVGDYGETVVIDWGLAKDLSDDCEDDVDVGPYRRDPETSSDLTAAGEIIGTAAYMPPEQAAGSKVDARADVYALGAILYHVLAGKPPYRSGKTDDVLDQVKRGPPSAIAEPAPRDLVSIVEKAMSRDPADRYPSARELAEELTKFQAGRLVGAHAYTRGELMRRWMGRNRRVLVVAVSALVALAGFGAFAIDRVIDERDRAEEREHDATAARGIAEDQRKKTNTLAVNLLAEQGRQELLAGNTTRALAWLNEAYKSGDTSAELRVMLAMTLRQVESIERTFGCDSSVKAIELSPDQTRLMAACGHGVKVWRLADGVLLTEIVAGVEGAHFSPDGRRIASWNYNHVSLWDALTGAEIFTRTAHTNRIREAHFAAGELLITTADDSTARVWDASGNVIRVLAAGSGAMNVVRGRLTPDRRTLLTYTGDGRIQQWDIATGARTRSLAQSQFMSSDIAPDGSRFVTCATDGTVRIWNLATGGATTFVAHAAAIFACSFSFDGRQLLTASADKTAKVWSVASGSLISSVVHGGLIASAGFSPDATRIVTLGTGSFALWHATSGTLIASMDGMKDEFFVFSRDGQRLVTVRDPNTIVVWKNLSNGMEPRAVAEGSKVIKTNPQGTQLAIRDVAGGISLVDAKSLRALSHEPVREPLVWSQDGSRFAAVAVSGGVAMIDTSTGVTASRIATTTKPTALELDENGRRLLVRGTTSQVWDTGPGTIALSFEEGIRVEGLSRSGALVVAVREPKRLEIWNVDRRKVQSRIALENKLIEVLGFDRDERHLVLTEFEGGEGGLPITLLRIHDAMTGATTFSVGGRLVSVLDPSRRMITTTEIGDKLEVLSASSGERLTWIANLYSIFAATVTPDRALLLGWSVNGQWQVRSATDGRLLAVLNTRPTFTITQDSFNWADDGGDESSDVASFVKYGANPIVWRFPRENRSPAVVDGIVRDRIPWRIVDGRLVVTEAAVRGRVMRHGHSVPNADVSIAFEDVEYRNHTRSGADGRFAFPELRSANYYIEGTSSDLAAKGRSSVRMIGDDVVIELELDREGSMSGSMVDDHGEPVAGAPVRALCCHGADGGDATTDAGGRFTIRGLGKGAYSVVVVVAQDGRKTGFAGPSQGVPAVLSDNAAKVSDLKLVVKRVDAAGAPSMQ